ncbi:MAG TPA: cation-efflux pump [Gammaproteobacteria bacterium]|nr:cation-efflux pump [Gammaproteobacteria bacterium]
MKNATNNERYQATKKVTLIGALVNLLLSTIQLLGGFFAGSQALIADGVHTLSDLASDFVVLVATREAHREADEEHPYGHGRIETLATSILGLALVAVAGAIFFDAIQRLFQPERLFDPKPIALLFAATAVFSKEALYQYTKRVAKRVNSAMLEANAWHHRSDAVSSLIVIVGILGSLAGIRYFDALAAIAVAGFIAHIGWKLLWAAGQELIDASLDESVVQQTESVIKEVDGVVDIHLLRTRKSGADAFADVHIQVPSKVSVSEGHQIAESVRKAIVEQITEITDVTVHTDPEDDTIAKACLHLPLREQITQQLNTVWQNNPLSEKIEKIDLHYLDGSIHLQLTLPLDLATHEKEIHQLKSAALTLKEIEFIDIYCHL